MTAPTHAVYQGNDRQSPLFSGGLVDCHQWCRNNGFRWNEATSTWDSGLTPQSANHVVRPIR